LFELRLGDEVDDYCTKCKRLTNHFILALRGHSVAKVRCRTCYNEQEFRDGVPLPPRPRSVRKPAEAPPAAVTDAAPEVLAVGAIPLEAPAADPVVPDSPAATRASKPKRR
jgi:hypothetical protein